MWIPFALSLDKYVNKAGTDVGFGCLLAVALLSVLYFAGARETRSLRDQLEEAQTRIAALEARVSQAMRNPGRGANRGAARQRGPESTQVPQVPGRPGVVPPPSVGAATGAGVSRGRREVGAVTGASAQSPAVTGALLGAPAGAGAPSLGSATKLIPSPEAGPVPVPTISRPGVGEPGVRVPAVAQPTVGQPGVGQPAAVPAAATAAALAASAPEAYADLDDDDYDDEFEPDDTMYVPAGGAVGGNSGRSRGGPAVAGSRSMVYDDDADDDLEPVGPPPRRTIPTVDAGPAGPSRFARRLIGGVVALLVVAAIVVVLLVVTGNGTHTTRTSTAARGTVTRQKTTPAVFKPASLKVAVLNGTGQAGLAGDVAKLISKSGYTVPAPAITNAAVQTDTTTTVAYRTGYRADAFRVAKSLSRSSGVAITQVVPAGVTAITSCATPTATGQAGTCPAKVIVTVGTDLESAATGASGA